MKDDGEDARGRGPVAKRQAERRRVAGVGEAGRRAAGGGVGAAGPGWTGFAEATRPGGGRGAVAGWEIASRGG